MQPQHPVHSTGEQALGLGATLVADGTLEQQQQLLHMKQSSLQQGSWMLDAALVEEALKDIPRLSPATADPVEALPPMQRQHRDMPTAATAADAATETHSPSGALWQAFSATAAQPEQPNGTSAAAAPGKPTPTLTAKAEDMLFVDIFDGAASGMMPEDEVPDIKDIDCGCGFNIAVLHLHMQFNVQRVKRKPHLSMTLNMPWRARTSTPAAPSVPLAVSGIEDILGNSMDFKEPLPLPPPATLLALASPFASLQACSPAGPPALPHPHQQQALIPAHVRHHAAAFKHQLALNALRQRQRTVTTQFYVEGDVDTAPVEEGQAAEQGDNAGPGTFAVPHTYGHFSSDFVLAHGWSRRP
jgi:hypothetical protein